jgi:hypothetical protein
MVPFGKWHFMTEIGHKLPFSELHTDSNQPLFEKVMV